MNTAPETITEPRQRQRLTLTGVVQGVGFRPHVYGCAQRCGVAGFVGNDSHGVFIEAEADAVALAQFQHELTTLAPPLAHIESLHVEAVPPLHERGFRIIASHLDAETGATASTLISPDIAVCADCLRELFDPRDRRFRYPFINCTNCGPRFTIIRDIPYDRPQTTMANFQQCAECQAEYDDPTNRRFHAQPNACPACGPRLAFVRRNANATLFHEAALRAAQQALLAGEIVALKGVGGFHLACLATSDAALQTLRERKGRVDKPFAVMARDLATAERLVEINAAERALLRSPARPIVLLKKRPASGLSELIAPGNAYLGVLLPYAPLHHVLLTPATEQPAAEVPDVLVMTSGNYSNEPIVTDNAAALTELADLADAFLLHDRAIHVPCDDSVVRVFEAHELPVRRSRGYAPFPVKLPFKLAPTLALGGELKATFCLVHEDHALLSQHIGDMENLETLAALEHAVGHFRALFRTEPALLVADKHPRYLSAQFAQQTPQRFATNAPRFVQVQHHHAHIAAVLAENGWHATQPVIGFAFDGTGYGDDGAIWGGEVLLADYRGFQRAAQLRYTALPGGDAAIKFPYRSALAFLWQAGLEWNEALPVVQACPPHERRLLRQQLTRQVQTFPTSSMGRLFDAAAALAGVRFTASYEAQAVIEFEALADPTETGSYAFALTKEAIWQIEAAPVWQALVDDVLTGVPVGVISARFHNAVAKLIRQLAEDLRTQTSINQIALSGGVFQNVTLLHKVSQHLHAAQFQVFTHRLVPPNDGGLALGQAVIANFRAER